MQNLRLALRTLRKTPVVTTVAVLSLALGIGANGAVFSLFNQLLLRPLPVEEPERLVNLGSPGPKAGTTSCNQGGDCEQIFSYPMFRDLEAAQTVFTGLAAHRAFGANLAAGGQTETGEGALVSGGYFATLGLEPALGRLLGPADEPAIGESRVAVLSHDYWRTRFAESREVLGHPIAVNGQRLEIVGVAPPGFHGTSLGTRPNVYVPITLRGLLSPGADGLDDRQSYWAYLFARLAPSVTRQRAAEELGVTYSAILAEVEAELHQGMSETTRARFLAQPLTLSPGARGQSPIRGEGQAALILLLGVAGVVLLIACANIANLLLARSVGRAAEISVRLSLGASRRRLVAQLLTEAWVLAALGGLAGLAVAHWTLVLLAGLMPAEAASVLDLHLDRSAIGFAAVLAAGTGLLVGLYPALHSTRLDLSSAIKGQAGQPSGSRRAARFRTALVTAQIALSLALLVSAGLFAKSLRNIGRQDLGIEIDRVVTFTLQPELNGYSPDRSRALFDRVLAETRATPGVTEVTASLVPLLGGSSWGRSVFVEGYSNEPDVDRDGRCNEVGAGYFQALGIPLLSGREFTSADSLDAPRVAVVNEEFTRKFGLGRQAVGKRMSIRGPQELDIEIVGVVADAKYAGVKDEVSPLFFTPFRQDATVGSLSFYVRSQLPAGSMLRAIRGKIAALDPDLPVVELKTLPQQVRDNVFEDRVITLLTVVFGLLATLLAAVGLYGVLAYAVSQRTRELGLRMALGADRSRVLGLVLRQLARLTALGVVIGLLLALGLGRLARSQLFGLQGHDPVVLIVALVALSTVALGAGLSPALQASKTDPMVALRHD